jgi:hypothetical protein
MATRAPYTLIECRRLFEAPATPRQRQYQRQYEALRSFFVEDPSPSRGRALCLIQ